MYWVKYNLQYRTVSQNFSVPAIPSPGNDEEIVWSTTGLLLRIQDERLVFVL
jgi:hypothetical protein